MNVFVNGKNVDNFALFKVELFLKIIEEMDLNDLIKGEIVNEIIILLDDCDDI